MWYEERKGKGKVRRTVVPRKLRGPGLRADVRHTCIVVPCRHTDACFQLLTEFDIRVR